MSRVERRVYPDVIYRDCQPIVYHESAQTRHRRQLAERAKAYGVTLRAARDFTWCDRRIPRGEILRADGRMLAELPADAASSPSAARE